MKLSIKILFGLVSLASFLAFSTLPLFGQTVETFTSNGTWNVPLGVTSVKIEAWGGGGGGAIGNIFSSSGNGGGGGAYITQTLQVNAGETYFITVGTGGSGNAEVIQSNKDGKTSSFTGPAGNLTANGGLGGTLTSGAGNGGTGDYNGGKGGSAASGYSGAGGGAAGNAGNGGNGGTSTAGASGIGSPNASPYIGGTGGVGRNTSGVGNAGNIPGGGGSGGKGTSSQTRAGGTGARGQVLITFTYDQCYDGTLTLTQSSGLVNQTVNQYYPIDDIIFDLGGNATGVDITGLPLGVTGSLNQRVLTISGTPLESGTFNYTLTTTGTPSPCVEATVNGTLTINPEPFNPLAAKIVFNESGTWQVPEKVSTITIKAWGGGGGGGAASNGAGGGGGGGAFIATIIPVTPGDIYTVTVGNQGSGGSYTIGTPGTSNGNAGNPSIVKDPGLTTILTAPGGSGGGGGLGYLSGLSIIQSNGSGGAGGTGDFNGGSGGTADNTSGSGGGGAGSAGNGGDGGTSNPGTGGLGSPNIPPFVGGLGGSQRTNNGQGNAGGLPGAGGSGARAWNYGPGYNGGAGARGQVVITFEYDGCLDGTLTLTSATGTDNQSLCHNIPIEDIKYTTGGFATGAEASGLPAGLTPNYNAGVLTISGTPTESGIFNYTITTTGTPDDCLEGTATGTITIIPAPGQNGEVILTFDASDSWVVPAGVTSITVEAWGGGGAGGGVELSFLGIGGGGGGGAYAIKNALSVTPLNTLDIVVAEQASGVAAGDGTDGSYSTILGFEDQIYAAGGKGGSESVLLSPYPFGGEGGLASESNGDCTVNGADGLQGFRITAVIPVPVPTPVDGAGGKGATSNGGNGGDPVGEFIGNGNAGSAPGGGGSGSRSALTTNFSTEGGSGAAGRVIISYICPEFSLTLNSVAGTDDQKACINEGIADIVYEIGGGATGAEVTGLPDGISGATENDVFTISGASTESETFNYTVTTTGHVSPCTPATATGTITIEDVATEGSLARTPDLDYVCQGSDVSAKLTAGTGGNGVDELEYRTKTGSNWSGWIAYTSESDISTTGKTGVEVQTRRTASYCTNSSYTTASWIVDITSPDVVAKTGVSVTLDPTGNYTLLADDLLTSYTDAGIGIQSVTMSPPSVNCSDLGLKTITVTVKDSCGNQTVVTPQITVVESSDLAPWIDASTAPAANGSATFSSCNNNGTFRLTATGQSSTTNDVFHFVYDTIGTVGTIIARLDDIDHGGWAGVMMRESLAPNAKTILFKTRLYNPNVIIGYRTSSGSAMRNLSQVAQLIHWMKIQRNGNTFQVFTSYNGISWLRRYTGTISMEPQILAGIFTESILSNRTSVAWFDNVELSGQLKTGDEFAEAEIIIPDSEQAEVSIYPNPARDQVNITLKGFRTLQGFGTLLTTDGKTIKTFTISESETQLNVQDLKPGVYILRIENAENVVVKRLVIQ